MPNPVGDTRVFTVKRLIAEADNFFGLPTYIAAGGLDSFADAATLTVNDAFAAIINWLGLVSSGGPVLPFDTTPPYLIVAVANGGVLTLTFSEDPTVGPPTSAFSVTGAVTGAHVVSNVAKSGQTVTLTLATNVAGSESVTVAYAKPGSSVQRLRGPIGNETAAFTVGAINNTPGTADVSAPNAVLAVRSSASHVTIAFDEWIGPGAAMADFAVTRTPVGGSPAANAVTGIAISGSTIVLTVTTDYAAGDAGTVTYAGTSVKDLAGNQAAGFGPMAVTIGGAYYTTRAALKATTVAALNASVPTPGDSETGFIVVGSTWPDQHKEELTLYAPSSGPDAGVRQWIGETIPIITQTDQEYMAVDWATSPGALVDKYVGKATFGGGGLAQAGWASRYIPYSGELIAAGLALQCRMSALLVGDGTNSIVLTPYLWADAIGSAVAHLNADLTPNAPKANGPSLTGPISNVAPGQYKNSGWTNVALGSAPGGGWAGTRLYVALFARMTAGGGATSTGIIDADVSFRWVAAG